MSSPKQALVDIPIELILDGTNVRLAADDELAESIRRWGILQPVVVTPHPDQKHVEVLAGHRRMAGARAAKLKVIPCVVRPRGDEEHRTVQQWVENNDRKEMTTYETALVVKRLCDAGHTQREVADILNVGENYVSQRLGLLKYPEPVLMAVHNRKIGLQTALMIPLDIARDTKPETMASMCRNRETVQRFIASKVRFQLKPSKGMNKNNVNVQIPFELQQRIRHLGYNNVSVWVTKQLTAVVDEMERQPR
jgi:ParB/RepB/Spo0J family partition protein